jgi:hypothetical protein
MFAYRSLAGPRALTLLDHAVVVSIAATAAFALLAGAW